MFRYVLRSEITKFFSYNWCVFGVVGSILLAPLLLALASPEHGTTMSTAEILSMVLRNFYISQAGLVIIAASFFGQEYSHSYLRTSLLAVPSRWQLIASKILILTGVIWLLGLVSTLLCFAVGYVQADMQLSLTIFQKFFSDVVVAMISWTLISWITSALSVITKSLIIPITIMFPFILGLSQMLLSMTDLFKYLPDLATMNLFFDSAMTTMLTVNEGIVTQLVWSLLFGALGVTLLKRRDVR